MFSNLKIASEQLAHRKKFEVSNIALQMRTKLNMNQNLRKIISFQASW